MRNWLRHLFGVYPGEGKNLFCFLRLAFLWSFGASIADTIGMSMFVEKVGATMLPFTYIIIASAMIASAILFLYLIKIIPPSSILTKVMQVAAILYVTVALMLLGTPSTTFWYFLQIMSYICITSLFFCFWIFLDEYHDLQDAKRIYGIYSAAVFLGITVAGSLINFAFNFIKPIGFFILAASSMLLGIWQLKHIIQRIAPVEDDSLEDFYGKKEIISTIKNFFSSPFALLLVAVSLIIQLLRVCTEFNYLQSFDKLFAATSSTDLIPQFLGKCKAFIAAGNILIGTLFYSSWVKRIGLGNMLLLPPIIFVSIYSQWISIDTLALAIAGIIAVEGILCAITENNFNLLMNAAPPKLKGSIRVVNDSLFEPIGMLISAIFLLWLSAENKIFGLALAVGFLLTSLLIRTLYPKSILTTLKQNAIHFDRKLIHWLQKISKKEQKEVKGDLLFALSSKEEKVSLIAFKTLLSTEDITLLPILKNALENFSEEGKIIALNYLENCHLGNDPQIIELICKWADKNSISTRALLYLAKKGIIPPEISIKEVHNSDILRKAVAILTLKKSKSNLSLPSTVLNRTIAARALNGLLKSKDEESICLALDILGEEGGFNAAEKLCLFFEKSSPKIKIAAAKALAKMANKSLSALSLKIVEKLKICKNNAFRLYCLEALGKIEDLASIEPIIALSPFYRPNERRVAETIISKMGSKSTPFLLSILKNVKLNDQCRILASKILAKVDLPILQVYLKDIIEVEIERAYFYFCFSNTIQKQYPLYDLQLLQSTLNCGFHSVIDFIIYLVGAAGAIEDCDLLVRSLHSKNAKVHAHALETLEKGSTSEIFKQICPLIDDLPWDKKLNIYSTLNQKHPNLSLTELLNYLENSPLLFDKTVSSYLKTKLLLPVLEKKQINQTTLYETIKSY